jgi:hypothetical protein
MATRKKKASKRRAAPARKPKLTLAQFFRALWKKPDLMERFSAGRDQRAEVLQKFNLTPAHRELLQEGCVHHIIRELAGVKAAPAPAARAAAALAPAAAAPAVAAAAAENTVIYAANEITCNHPECRAFMSTLKPT